MKQRREGAGDRRELEGNYPKISIAQCLIITYIVVTHNEKISTLLTNWNLIYLHTQIILGEWNRIHIFIPKCDATLLL